MGIAELLREQILVKDIKIKLNIAKTLFLLIVAKLTKYLNEKMGYSLCLIFLSWKENRDIIQIL